MIRDIDKIVRDLEEKRNNDIILKKNKLEEMFYQDPDLLEVLGQKEKQPLNQYADPNNPTDEELEERRKILDYNERISHKQIIPFLKLNELQKEVVNFIMFDIEDSLIRYGTSDAIKQQNIVVMCLVQEDDMDTQYGIQRADLLSYIVRDLLCWTNALGSQLRLASDYPEVTDSKYYCRTLKFIIEAPNVVKGHMGKNNKYDRFQSI